MKRLIVVSAPDLLRRLAGLLLSVSLLCALSVPALAAEGSMENFRRTCTYQAGQFTDVSESAWYAKNVAASYELGFIKGVTATTFNPEGSLTVAEALVMGSRLHSIYWQDGADFQKTNASDRWYQPYIDYAYSNQFLPYWYDDYNEPISRGDFAMIMAACLPEEAFPEKNSITEGSIPEVASFADYHDAVYLLYRAGVLAGSDWRGSFHPFQNITRAEAATVLCNVADTSMRRTVTVTPKEFTPVPMKQLANYAGFKKRMSDAEFTQAYNAALEIVRPLANLSQEEQLYGIAIALRELMETSVTYSTSQAHYNDPYGYFVLHVASCAGCARATGLCLNILGISYEHVNENQWSHQWCRVNINGTYWICDAYGLACCPEPAPYQHPYLS